MKVNWVALAAIAVLLLCIVLLVLHVDVSVH